MATIRILSATFIFIIATTYGSAADVCPTGFTQHSSSCYLFSILKMPWIQAMKLCTIYEAELVVIDTAEEQNYLQGVMHTSWSAYNHTVNGVWIGGTDLIDENDWIWAVTQDGITYTHWGPGQPDNRGDCLSIVPQSQYTWNDEQCETRLNFICERSIFASYVPPSFIG